MVSMLFFMFTFSSLMFSLCSSTLTLSSLINHITSILNYVSGRLLASILFSSFSGILSYSFIWTCFFVCTFRLPPCVCFYVLDRAAMSPGFGRVILYSRCSMGPSCALSVATSAGYFRDILFCALFVPSCCSWALITIGT